jgi:hypothetical protein
MPIARGAVFTISAASAKTTSGNSGVLNLPDPDAAMFILNVTASSSPTTLDVYLQHSPDSGTTWYDFAHFTQVGAVATSIQAMNWDRKSDATNAASTAVTVTGDAAIAASVVISAPIVASQFRAKWVIAGTSYTFSLIMVYDRD